jgi:penicillin-binding protein 1A
VYGAALEMGMSPGREFKSRNAVIRLPGNTPGNTIWQPRDEGAVAGDKTSLEDGLVYSRNAVTAQVMNEVGPAQVVKFAQRMGVRDSRLEAVPSLALGTSPVTLLEMASAYGTIAALGEYRAPVLITQVSDAQGNVLAQFVPAAGTQGERVLQPDVALQLIDMLRAAVDRGTGRGIRDVHAIQADVGGKTGTTQNNADGWFILMHPRLVAGAWVGFNDPRVTLRSDHWGQGAHNALHVVGDFMHQAVDDKAIDATATFPSRVGVTVQSVLRRAGEALRSLFGLGKK